MELISVTTALGRFVDWNMVPPALLELAGDRGTRVHDLIPSLIFPDRYPLPDDHIIEPDIVGYIESFRNWYDKMVDGTWFIEKEIRCNCYGYIGHIDWIGILKGENNLSVLDWKTPITASKTWPLQIAGYWHLVEKHLETYHPHKTMEWRHPVARCGTIMLKRDGKPATMKEYTKFNALSFNYFLQALNLAQYFGNQ